jgi:hypothetical protein
MSDEVIRETGPEWTAVLRVVYAMTEHDFRAHEADDGPNILQVAADAANSLNDLEQRLSELESVVDTDFRAMEYEQMTRQDKARMIQAELIEEAKESANGKAAFDYNDVLWLFNKQPSKGHSYDLMELAAEASGFDYQEREGSRKNRITVDMDAVNEEPVFHGVNTPEEEKTA